MKDLYLGIDLGTTNSVVAYGNLMRNGSLKCNVIELERKTENGGQAREKTLPSVVYYYKDPSTGEMKTEIGEYAKGRYGIKLGYVSKSVKSLMGTSESSQLAEEIEDKTPAEVSGQILRYMLNQSKKRLMDEELKDVVITVPASFDSEQCQATIEAARLAGFDVDNTHDILLYEPKAVIFDFVNMMESGELLGDMIDFDEPKNILVFDLGGGTLDVTIHRVGYVNQDMMNIEDLAISRYTKIGGDNFDELLAEAMLPRFEQQWNITVPEVRREEVMCKLRGMAENLKMEVSSDIENARNFGKELSDDYYKEIWDMTLFDSYSYTDEFVPSEIEKIVSPLMGEHLSLQDVKRIDQLKEKDMNNIIYPILDVLAKAGQDCKIDAVILNGGMTRFFPIKKRIDEFFGLNSLITNDPDLAVARGAVYYHYCLHKYGVKKTSMFHEEAGTADTIVAPVEAPVHIDLVEQETPGFNVGTILNDSLNIGLGGEYVSRLVEAGTKLPYVSPEIKEKYYFGSNSDTMSLQIFLGRGKTKNLPNRRIADRLVKFDKQYPANTPISLQISIDNLRFMRLEAWITGQPQNKAVVTIDTNGKRVDKVKSTATSILTTEELRLNAKSEINNLKILASQGNKKSMKNIKHRTMDILEQIKKASNKEEFYGPIKENLDLLGQREHLRGYLYAISCTLAEGWTERQKMELLKCCKSHFQPCYYGLAQDSYVLMTAINYIARWDEQALRVFDEILSSSYFVKCDRNIVEAMVEYMDLTNQEVLARLERFQADLFTKNTIMKLYKKLEDKEVKVDLYAMLVEVAGRARESDDFETYTAALGVFCKVIDLYTLEDGKVDALRKKLKVWKKHEENDARYFFTDTIEQWLISRTLSSEQEELIAAYL